MSRTLTPAQARAAFDELATKLPKQHLRLQFRKRFGTGELLDPAMLRKATTVVTREKPITNLLQEVPESIFCIRLSGTNEEISGADWTTDPAGTIGSLLDAEEVEQGLIIQGRKARLYAYSDPTEGTVYVLRAVTEAFGEDPISTSDKPSAPKKRSVSRTGKPLHRRQTFKKSSSKGRSHR